MARGGFRPGAGRPRATVAAVKKMDQHAAKMVETGVVPEHVAKMSPIDIMLSAMQIEYAAGHHQQAAAIANMAAPYIHPKLSQQTVINATEPATMSDDQLAAIVAAAEARNLATLAAASAQNALPSSTDHLKDDHPTLQ